MTYLLDSDVTIARASPDHLHYLAAIAWLRLNPNFALCPLTEGALIRAIFRSQNGAAQIARQSLQALTELEGYQFWPANLSHRDVPLDRLQGHKQITDAYLVALATSYDGRLATFDRALVAVPPEAVLVPTP